MRIAITTNHRRVFLWRDQVAPHVSDTELLGELDAEAALDLARALLAAVPSDCCEACGTLKPIPRAAVTFGAVEAQSYAPPRKEPGGIAGHAERLAAHLAEHPLDLTVPKTERRK